MSFYHDTKHLSGQQQELIRKQRDSDKELEREREKKKKKEVEKLKKED